MKSKIITLPVLEREADGYTQTTAVFELSGTVCVLSINAFGGDLGLEIRHGTLSDLSRFVDKRARGANRYEIRAITKQVHADELAVPPAKLTPRLELIFRERVMEVLTAAGVSNHARLAYMRRAA